MRLEIYLTNLSAYNAGYLIGKWIRLPLSKEELDEAIQEVLRQGEEATGEANHEELFITDYQWCGMSLCVISEYENLDKLNETMELLQDATLYQQKAMKFLLDENISQDIEDAYYRSDDVTIHEDMNMEDIAYELMRDCYAVDKLPSIIANNIDYYSIGQELEMDGCYTSVDYDVYEYHR